MKKLILAFVFCIGSFLASSQCEFKRYWDSGYLQQTGYVTQVCVNDSMMCVPDGHWMMYDSQGTVIAQAYYELGVKVGTWEWKLDDRIIQLVYDQGHKVRYLEIDASGKLLFLKDFQ